MNLQRSKTAEELFKNDDRFQVRSSGTDKYAATPINEPDLEWADFIIVMEKFHRNKIRSKYPKIYNHKKIICLYIEDEYDFMEEELIRLVTNKFEFVYKKFIEYSR